MLPSTCGRRRPRAPVRWQMAPKYSHEWLTRHRQCPQFAPHRATIRFRPCRSVTKFDTPGMSLCVAVTRVTGRDHERSSNWRRDGGRHGSEEATAHHVELGSSSARQYVCFILRRPQERQGERLRYYLDAGGRDRRRLSGCRDRDRLRPIGRMVELTCNQGRSTCGRRDVVVVGVGYGGAVHLQRRR